MSRNGSDWRCIFTYFYQHMYFYLFLPTHVFLPIFTNFMRTGVTRRQHDHNQNNSQNPNHLHASFQILNSLKKKRNKHKTTLEKLTIHKNDNTLPNGLKHITNCNILLEEDLQRRWMKASKDAAKVN